MRDLLKQMTKAHNDLKEEDQSIFCPFHPDAEGGHPSAKYYHEDNSIYCWSCGKAYRPYDALKQMGYSDGDIANSVKGAVDTLYDLDAAVSSLKKRKKAKSLFDPDKKDQVADMKRYFVSGQVPVSEYVHGLMECFHE